MGVELLILSILSSLFVYDRFFLDFYCSFFFKIFARVEEILEHCRWSYQIEFLLNSKIVIIYCQF